MRRHIRAAAAVLAAVYLCLALSACGGREREKADTDGDTLSVTDCPIQHETEFGGVYIEITIDEFNDLGFEYGDSVKVVFSNGYTLDDIPYYNGYYVDAGSPLLIAYPGYDYIKAAINYGDDLWEKGQLHADLGSTTLYAAAELDEHCTASVYLNEHGKYADIQAARDIHYSDDRSKFDSDAVFANFRNVQVGDIAAGVFYRSASPCDNQHNRAPYVDDLIEEAGVMCILDLADSAEKVERYIAAEDFDSPYFLSLYEDGKVIPLSLDMNYYSDSFKAKLIDGLSAMAEMEGPYLVHCTEGKDRTGFVCMIIEALAGAGYDEIVDDYMVTYANYYDITEQTDRAKYDTILEKNLIAMIRAVVGDESVDITTADLSAYVKNYLTDAGMSDAAIEKLVSRLSGSGI